MEKDDHNYKAIAKSLAVKLKNEKTKNAAELEELARIR